MQGKVDSTTFDTVEDDLFEVRETAIALAGQNDINIDDVFFMKDINDIEYSIKKLNEYSDKCWLLSSIVLYKLVYDKEMYSQTGLTWQEYIVDSKKRLGLAHDEVSRQLSSAKFFISHYKALQRANWSPAGNARKLSSAQMALELCNNIDEVIQHLCEDSWRDFHSWYTSLKALPAPVEEVDCRPDITIEKSTIKVNGINAVTISDALPEKEKKELEGYLEQIYKALKRGEVPAIVPVYDDKEAKTLIRLRDKNRQGK